MSPRYGDLVQFEPIESVIQLLDADDPEHARGLVSSYVISDDMADRIARVMIPQMSLDESLDHKGVFVVGNYGTGKSHLMSVLSLIAEDAAYVPSIRHAKVRDAATAIAGRFKVHRIEISSLMSLRDIVTRELETFLSRQGVPFAFPPADRVVNNKGALEEMMASFAEVHPTKGILLVVDEFLDYLRSRKDHDLVVDLSFLRELGEVTKHLRFRFIAGVQEAIFDNSRFQHVSDSLRRVKDRFAQVTLARQDVSFVVAERLLKKSLDQQERIRGMLTPFAKFYDGMSDRMDDYVRLFPVHPDYVGTFERLVFTEKRGALVTLRDQIQAILADEVPEDRPGLISYDRFWETVTSNPVLRADPNIGPVLKVSEVLNERVRKAFTRPTYKAMALRIIDALSVHRLTTGGDIYVPIGPTAEELRDSLSLFQPGIGEMGGDPASDLLSLVQTVLREVLRTVNGQFISKGADNEQFYLDLKKDVDYDAQVEKRSEALSDDVLDRAYYAAIRQLMERTDDAAHVFGHQIWQYQLEWLDRRVERIGYLVFGAPPDRPTAQPERDFYVYFVQPHEPPRFRDEQRADEAFIRLKGLDAGIRRLLSTFAAAQDLASTAGGGAKAVYVDKARDAVRDIGKWLREKQMNAFEMTHQGRTKSIQDWVRGTSLRDRARIAADERVNFRDVVNVAAGIALNPHFADLAPKYPSFPALVTEANRRQLVTNALRMLAGGSRTKDAIVILEGLELLDGERIDATRSSCAREVLARLKARGHGQVLNRGELLSGGSHAEHFDPNGFRLEPDLLVVVIGGLIHAGDVVLAIAGDKIDSGRIALLAERSLDDLTQFKHLEAPKEMNVATLRALFELLGLPPGLALRATQGYDEPVKSMQEQIGRVVRRVLGAVTDIALRSTLWGQQLLRDGEARDQHAKLTSLKAFCEGLIPFNTLGKLKNLRIEPRDIATQQANLEALRSVEMIQGLVGDLGATAAYLSQAEMVLPPGDGWIERARAVRSQILDELADPQTVRSAGEYRQVLDRLRQDYVQVYGALHGRARLGVSAERTKSALSRDPRLSALRALADVPILPAGQVAALQERLAGLRSCSSLIDSDLSTSPVCPHCHFRPANEQGELLPVASVLTRLGAELDGMVDGWELALLSNLDDPTIAAKLDLLKPATRAIVDEFRSSRKFPRPVTPEFVAAIREALSGLERVGFTSEDVGLALLQGGMPATIEDLRRRFDAFLADRSRGRDATRLRFVVD